MNKQLRQQWEQARDYLVGRPSRARPVGYRVRRLLVAIPVAGTLVLLGWTYFFREPLADRLLRQNQDLIVLENQINAHRMRLSEQQFTDVQVRQRDAELFLVPDEAAASQLLARLLAQAAALGWTPASAPAAPTLQSVDNLPEFNYAIRTLDLTYSGGQGEKAYANLLKWFDELNRLDRRVEVLSVALESATTAPLHAKVGLRTIRRVSQ